jgi:hypothetical protein
MLGKMYYNCNVLLYKTQFPYLVKWYIFDKLELSGITFKYIMIQMNNSFSVDTTMLHIDTTRYHYSVHGIWGICSYLNWGFGAD